MIFDKVKEIIVDELGVEEEKVTMETDFEDGLSADSLDTFQIISEIEDEFDITIDTDGEGQNIKTVGDLVNYIEKVED